MTLIASTCCDPVLTADSSRVIIPILLMLVVQIATTAVVVLLGLRARGVLRAACKLRANWLIYCSLAHKAPIARRQRVINLRILTKLVSLCSVRWFWWRAEVVYHQNRLLWSGVLPVWKVCLSGRGHQTLIRWKLCLGSGYV